MQPTNDERLAITRQMIDELNASTLALIREQSAPLWRQLAKFGLMLLGIAAFLAVLPIGLDAITHYLAR